MLLSHLLARAGPRCTCSALPTQSIHSHVSEFPGGADRADTCSRQLAQECHFLSLATTGTVVVIDFLLLFSLSVSKQAPQLVIMCPTAVSASSMGSVRLRSISQAESPSTAQVPQVLLRKRSFPTRVPSQPLPPRLPFLPSQTPNTHHQTQSPKGSARCPVLSINKRLPQYGNLSNRIVSGFCTKELSVLQVAGSQPVPRQQYCSKHQGLRSEPSFVLYKLTARHHARQ